MSDGNTILLTFASMAIGSAVSWLIARWYYLRSGTDLDVALRHVADRRGVNAIARMLEQAGIGKASYDAAGNLTGVVITATAHAHGSSTATFVGSSTVTPPPQYDRQDEQPLPEDQGGHDT